MNVFKTPPKFTEQEQKEISDMIFIFFCQIFLALLVGVPLLMLIFP